MHAKPLKMGTDLATIRMWLALGFKLQLRTPKICDNEWYDTDVDLAGLDEWMQECPGWNRDLDVRIREP